MEGMCFSVGMAPASLSPMYVMDILTVSMDLMRKHVT